MGPLQTQKIPHLHIHKPKTVVVETVLVVSCKWGTSCTNIAQIQLDWSEELYKCHYIIYHQTHRSGRGLASCLPVGPAAAVGGQAGQV